MTPLTSIDLRAPDGAVRFAGVQEARPTADGVALSRLSAAALQNVVLPSVHMLAAFMPGARVELLSDTTTVELELQITRLELPTGEPTPVSVDLVVDGELVDNAAVHGGTVLRLRTLDPPDIEVEAGGPSSVRFDGLPSNRKRIELWLPHNAAVEVRALRVDARRARGPAGADTSPVGALRELDQPVRRSTEADIRLAGAGRASRRCRPVEPRFAGEAQLDQFVARDIRDLDLDLVSLKVGINVVNADSMRERAFVPAAHAFLDTIRDGHPTVPIVVATPIICPAVEDRPGPTAWTTGIRCTRSSEPSTIPTMHSRSHGSASSSSW